MALLQKEWIPTEALGILTSCLATVIVHEADAIGDRIYVCDQIIGVLQQIKDMVKLQEVEEGIQH